MITGEQIKQAREEKNLSQEELSELLGVSRQAVSKWENGLSVPQGENRRRLTEVLELETASSEEKGEAAGKAGAEDKPDGRLPGEEADPGRIPEKAQGKTRAGLSWLGWTAAAFLLAVLIGTRIYPYPKRESVPEEQPESQDIRDRADRQEEAVERIWGDVHFYDKDQKEVPLRDAQYNSAQIDSILVQWNGEGAKYVNMYYCSEKDVHKELILTQAIPEGYSAVLLNGESVGAYMQGQIFLEIGFADKTWISELYPVFYDPTVLVYIREFDGTSMVFDEVEWVVTPGERATQLGLVNDGSGFVVYNETELTEEFPLSGNCVCTVLDWSENFAPKEVTPQEFSELLAERGAPEIPYRLTIEDGQVVAVQEHYVP